MKQVNKTTSVRDEKEVLDIKPVTEVCFFIIISILKSYSFECNLKERVSFEARSFESVIPFEWTVLVT